MRSGKPKKIADIADEDIIIDDLSVDELREYTRMDIESDDESEE